LYVSNLIDESVEQGMQRKGSFDDPFAQLSDAIAKAKGLAAPFTKRVDITIHLFSGDHFVIENRRDALNIYQERENVDIYQLNINMIIKPLSCSHQPSEG
jgi:hypothetical protein